MTIRFPASTRHFGVLPVALCVSSLVLASCGGGGSTDTTPSGPEGPVVVGDSDGESADGVETSELLRKAATGTSTNLGKNITSVQRLGGKSSSIGLLLNANAFESVTAGSTGETLTSEEILNTSAEESIGSFIEALLGLDDETADVTRVGNRITIDPNDAAFCESTLLDETATATEAANCQSLISNILVQMDAATVDSGLITVNFAQQELLIVGYTPSNVDYEIKLSGLQSLLTEAAQLEGEIDSVPSMQGAIRFSATLLDDTVNAESGTFSISVTEALSIVDNAGTNISLRPSTLLSVTSDAATGTGSIELDVGALSATFNSEDDFGGMTSSVLAFSGLTARMDVSNDGDDLIVSNVGIGNGPLTLSVNSVEQLRLMLDTFGFSVQGDSGVITLNDDLGISLSIAQLTTVGAVAPSGTSFVAQSNGASQVSQGGPFTVSFTTDNNGSPVTDSISVSAGSCFTTDDVDAPLAIVDCDL